MRKARMPQGLNVMLEANSRKLDAIMEHLGVPYPPAGSVKD